MVSYAFPMVFLWDIWMFQKPPTSWAFSYHVHDIAISGSPEKPQAPHHPTTVLCGQRSSRHVVSTGQPAKKKSTTREMAPDPRPNSPAIPSG